MSNEVGKQSLWESVHTSLLLRWPDLNSEELKALPSERDSVREYVRRRTSADTKEIDAIINQHLGRPGQESGNRQESQSDNGSEASVMRSARERLDDVRCAATSMYQRTEDQMSEHPAQGALITFLTGVAVGALVTALLINAAPEPEPTTWEKYGPKNWRYH